MCASLWYMLQVAVRAGESQWDAACSDYADSAASRCLALLVCNHPQAIHPSAVVSTDLRFAQMVIIYFSFFIFCFLGFFAMWSGLFLLTFDNKRTENTEKSCLILRIFCVGSVLKHFLSILWLLHQCIFLMICLQVNAAIVFCCNILNSQSISNNSVATFFAHSLCKFQCIHKWT